MTLAQHVLLRISNQMKTLSQKGQWLIFCKIH